MPDIGKCRSCGAMMIWVRMDPSGKANPLDPDPVPNGNILVENGVGITIAKADRLPEHEGRLYISHFATCPNSRQHRKKAQ